MKTEIIKCIGVFVLLMNISFSISAQKSTQQDWSMELSAKSVTIQSFINDWYEVNSSQNRYCDFYLTYDHGMDFDDNPNITFFFEYFLYKNGDEIDYHKDAVDGALVNDYVVHHKFYPTVLANNNNVFTGGLQIYHKTPPPANFHTDVLILSYTENSIEFAFGDKEIVISKIFQPTCAEIVPKVYYDIIQATESITFNPGFSVDSEIFNNFTAEIVKSGSKNNNYYDNISQKSSSKTKPDLLDEFIEIYPNPSNGNFTIKNISQSEIKISLHGRLGEIYPSKKLKGGAEYNVTLEQFSDRFVTVLAMLNGEVIGKQIVLLQK